MTQYQDNPYDGTQLCAQTDSEIFFPETFRWDKKTLDLAISVCNNCHLMLACREYADNQNGTYGVWGGKLYDGSNYKSPIQLGSPRKVA
jgi:Transcription factor WhiB